MENKKDRKLLQLCAQVKRCLILALADSENELVSELELVEVLPNPNAGRMMVYVNHGSASRDDILEALKEEKGELRYAVAGAISRKKTPELAFETMPQLVDDLTKEAKPMKTGAKKKMPRNYDVMCGDKAGHSPIKMWTRGVEVEDTAKQQLYNMSQMPFIHKYIAVMPDCHWGNGACVGSVIPTVGAIIPAAVGVDLGCFTGDTLIPTLDGKSYAIKDLAERKDDFYVFSCTDTDKITAKPAKAFRTRKNAPLLKVTLDNGKSVRCTPDHRFMLRDGSYCEAKDLTSGTSLMPCYQKIDDGGYAFVQQPYSLRWQRVHWLVGRAGLLGKIPKAKSKHPKDQIIIHHISFMEEGAKADNRPCNLRFMSQEEHGRLHRTIGGKWPNKDPDFQKRRRDGIRRYVQENLEKVVKTAIKNITTYMNENREEWLKKIAKNGERGKKYLLKYNQSEKGKAKSREISNRQLDCPMCEFQTKGYAGLMSHIRHKHKIMTLEEAKKRNHKVISVEVLKDREDVYCLNVPDLHNFALEAGVFVHNCGMMAQRTSLTSHDLPESLREIRSLIEQGIPHGRTNNGGRRDKGAWGNPPAHVDDVWKELEFDFELICEKHPKIARSNNRNHLATLGTGNHFVEVCLDKEDRVWIMLHSGSRGVGGRIGSYFIEKAKEEMKRWFINLPDINLAYIAEGSEYFDDYVEGVGWAQRFALANRTLMMKAALKALEDGLGRPFDLGETAVNCHHNYITKENHFGKNVWVTRKGAVRAREGDLGIIPGSMGAKSFIVRGKGNDDSFHSCSHGAGRKMSRTAAKRKFSIDDHIRMTKGVECRKDADVIDETPGAYKSISSVMEAQSDLVEVVHTLKQIVCVKG